MGHSRAQKMVGEGAAAWVQLGSARRRSAVHGWRADTCVRRQDASRRSFAAVSSQHVQHPPATEKGFVVGPSACADLELRLQQCGVGVAGVEHPDVHRPATAILPQLRTAPRSRSSSAYQPTPVCIRCVALAGALLSIWSACLHAALLHTHTHSPAHQQSCPIPRIIPALASSVANAINASMKLPHHSPVRQALRNAVPVEGRPHVHLKQVARQS
mgnify:CR=1 FL=1